MGSLAEWAPRLQAHFGNAVVDKSMLTHVVPGLPAFISESILCQYLSEPASKKEVLRRYQEALERYVPHGAARDAWHRRLQTDGEIAAIARYRVEVNVERSATGHTLKVPVLGINKGTVADGILEAYPRLLTTGIWGLGKLALQEDGVRLVKFHSFVVPQIDMVHYVTGRQMFTEAEWVDILTSSLCLNPRSDEPLSRLKLLRLCRLVPLVQDLVFLAEFGPPGTGKTYLYDQLATHSFVVSGAQATPAQMFYNLRERQPGLLAQWPCVVLDEIDKVSDRELSEELVNKLLKYMESGEYDRGTVQVPSTTSIVFSGNVPRRRGSNGPVFSGMAKKLQHPAFLDRLCGLVPGDEFPVLGQKHETVSTDPGFTADYFSQILLALRRRKSSIADRVRMEPGAMVRDEKAVKRVFEGLVKLVFPDGEASAQDLQKYLDLAVELRQAVIMEKYALHHETADFRTLRARIV